MNPFFLVIDDGEGRGVPSLVSSREVMNSGVRFISCMISSAVWERTESICGSIVGRGTESLLSALGGRGNGVDADAAVAKGGCEVGCEDASERERFKEEDSSSESSSMRVMVIDHGGLRKVEVPRPNMVSLRISEISYLVELGNCNVYFVHCTVYWCLHSLEQNERLQVVYRVLHIRFHLYVSISQSLFSVCRQPVHARTPTSDGEWQCVV